MSNSVSALWLNLHKTGGIILAIRAKPTGKRNRIVSVNGPTLEVELAAKPQNGEANAELIDYISDVLRVRKCALRLLSGDRCRDKQLLLQAGLLDSDKIKELVDIELNS